MKISPRGSCGERDKGRDFDRRMAEVCRRIPYGKAATYGQIALLCGFPGYARRVGYALSHRQLGEIPAHRIVNAKGYLSGAGAFEEPGLQRRLLESEGVAVSEDDRVSLKRDGWNNTWQEAEELRLLFEREDI